MAGPTGILDVHEDEVNRMVRFLSSEITLSQTKWSLIAPPAGYSVVFLSMLLVVVLRCLCCKTQNHPFRFFATLPPLACHFIGDSCINGHIQSIMDIFVSFV